MSTYIGGRIIPKHAGTWDEQAEYETLTVVLDEETGNSYISRKAVPAGTALDDEEYWAKSSDYSVQLKNIQDAVDVLEAQVTANVTASTDADADYAAEVVDARIDADGNTHDSLGAHIRDVDERKVETTEDVTGELITGSMVNCKNGNEQTFSNTYCTEMIPVNRDSQKVYYSGRIFNYIGICGYDLNGEFVSSILDTMDEGAVTEDYEEEELTIPEGVAYIRASSYVLTPTVKIETLLGDTSAQVAALSLRLDEHEEENEVLFDAQEGGLEYLAVETLAEEDLSFSYSSGNVWSYSSPLFTDYTVPLTVLSVCYIQSISFKIKVTEDCDLTVTLAKDDVILASGEFSLTEGTNSVTFEVAGFYATGEYALGVSTDEQVLCYPSRTSSNDFIETDYISNEGTVYLYNNELICFMGTITIRSGIAEETRALAEENAEKITEIAEKLENVSSASEYLAEEVLSEEEVDFSYSTNIWSASSPIFSDYTVPLTVLSTCYIKSLSFTIRTQADCDLTITFSKDDVVYGSSVVSITEGDNEVTLELGAFFSEGEYAVGVSTDEAVLCYPVRTSSEEFVSNEYITNEGTVYLYNNELIVFKGTVTLMTADIEEALSLGQENAEAIAELEEEVDAVSTQAQYLADQTLAEEELDFSYSTNIWLNTSPIFSTYSVPLTVLSTCYIQSLSFTIRTQADCDMTVEFSKDGDVLASGTFTLEEGDTKVTLTLGAFYSAGEYAVTVSTDEAVLCYPARSSSENFVTYDYITNEGTVYLYNNELIVFKGTVTILSGAMNLDSTLSKDGYAADAGAVGDAVNEINTAVKGKLDKQLSANLLDPDAYRPGWFAYTSSSSVTYHSSNLRYGATDYIPVSENGLVTSGSGTNGVTSQIVYDEDYNALRYVDSNDQYTYEEGDAYVVFCYFKSSAESLCVVEGTEYEFVEYTDYLPLLELEERVEALEDEVGITDEETLSLLDPGPVYTVCNDLDTDRNYAVEVWLDHLVADASWTDKDAGFGSNKDKSFHLYAPFTSSSVNEDEEILETTVTQTIESDDFTDEEVSLLHRCTLSSACRDGFPKVLVLGDSVTDGYLAGWNKGDSSLPNHYWSWVRYFFERDKLDADDEDGYNCLMMGISMSGVIGSSNSFTLEGTTYKNYACGQGGWSAEDLNLEYYGDSTKNPFYDEETEAFSLKACLDKYKTLDDDGVTRLVVGDTAGSEVTSATAYDLCTPTHVVINLNHNSSLSEYQETIPGIIATIQEEYPDVIIVLMSIDETGTHFPSLYPNYSTSNITIGSLHTKNATIYQYMREELEDEDNGVYVLSGNLVQNPTGAYPTFEYLPAEFAGREDDYIDSIFHGMGTGGGPNWHPNNRAHAAWGYQLYAFLKYSIAKAAADAAAEEEEEEAQG